MFGKQVSEGLRPARAERWHVDDAAKLFDVAIGQIQQRVDIGDTELVTAPLSAHNVVAGANRSFSDDPKIEARTMLRDKQSGHLRLTEAHADAKAGDPRLGDLEFGATDAIAIADAHVFVGEPGDSEVFTEVPGCEVVTVQ